MAAYFSPVGNGQVIDSNGNPIVGAQIFTYAAGSVSPIASFKDSAGTIAQANPAITNSLGALNDPLWLSVGVTYKIIIKDNLGVTLFTYDNITGIESSGVAGSVDEWVSYVGAATYISATQFSVAGNQTGTFQVGRKVKSQNTGGVSYGEITARTYSAPNTIVTVANSVLALDSGLSAMYYGFLSAVNSAIPNTAVAVIPPAVVNISNVSSSIAWDLTSAPFAKITLDGVKSFTITGLGYIGFVALEITNPASHTATFAAGYKFAGRPAYAPDLGSGGNVTLLSGFCNGASVRFSPIPFVS